MLEQAVQIFLGVFFFIAALVVLSVPVFFVITGFRLLFKQKGSADEEISEDEEIEMRARWKRREDEMYAFLSAEGSTPSWQAKLDRWVVDDD